MLTKKQIEEIRVFLKKSKNPLFFFDDDSDGLAAALTLKKVYNKGTIVPLKISVHSEDIYLQKIQEHNPDTVFILDRPLVPQIILDNIKVPVIWIDHHEPAERFNVHYYNPTVLDKNDNRSTSFWAYEVAQKNMWIALIGIIGDWQVPPYITKFKYIKLLDKQKTAPGILFDSTYGKLIRIFHFNLKGQTKDVRRALNAMEKVKTPQEILNQITPEGKLLYTRYEKFNKEYQELYNKAVKHDEKGDIFIFTYPTQRTSFGGELSNELLYRLTHHNVFIVGRLKEDRYLISIRGRTKPVRPIFKKALQDVDGYGGGHPLACGGSINKDDFTKFLDIFKKEMKLRKM
jgi:oligoribonuclease NrnB/cAMP/cGMP phosphodiesterase (DHH superfamily)